MNGIREILVCRVCNGTVETMLDLGNQYVSDFPKPKDSKRGIQAPLRLVKCKTCELVQLSHTVNPDKMFSHFWYQSAISSTMKSVLKDIVNEALKVQPLQERDVVVDIGCNDGTLLRQYPNQPEIVKIGFEPAVNVATKAQDAADFILSQYFNAKGYRFATDKKAKLVTSIAMFYDLDDPNSFVEDVKDILDSSGTWIIQMNYLGAMLRNNCYDNICHEHLEYYSLTSLEHLLRRHDLEAYRVEENSVNGGSFKIYIGHKDKHNIDNSIPLFLKREKQEGFDDSESYRTFKIRIDKQRQNLLVLLRELSHPGGRIYVYGASTRGNTLLQYCRLDWLPKATDANPEKWGRVTVGTGIPIISKMEARHDRPDYFLVLPYHFLDEILEEEKDFVKNGGRFIVPIPVPIIVP